jgi:hypothetical protein
MNNNTNTVKVTAKLADLASLYTVLGNLDGFWKTVGDKPVLVPYKFDDSVRRAIARNRRLLKPIVEELQERKNAILAELSEGTMTIDDKDEAKLAQLALRHLNIDKEKETIELLQIDESLLLKDDKNPIPGTTLEHLGLITDPAPAAETEAAEPAEEQPGGA